MSRQIDVKLDGRSLPCRLTMGALLEYKRFTGSDISTTSEMGPTEALTFIYCCIKSSSRHDGVEFGLSLEEFADAMEPDDLLPIVKAVNEPTVKNSKKKK